MGKELAKFLTICDDSTIRKLLTDSYPIHGAKQKKSTNW